MRLRTLELIRYGKFTDFTIDFGERQGDQPDFHIVYGPNEAGKTTALSAYLDLLYGIERKSAYDFLHEYSVMRIGARIESNGRVQSLFRVKRNQNSLLDGQDQPVAEQVVQQHLGGIDRDTYRAMFSLDDDTLEAGGESILASDGDLGEMLFSATAGLADLSATLAELRTQTDAFYRPHARATRLAVLKAEIADLKSQREALDTAASAYAQLVDAADKSKTLYEAALIERGAAQARIDEIRRILGALPRLAALHDLRQRLQPLAGLPSPPQGWKEALPDLQAANITLNVQLNSADQDIARCNAELGDIKMDEAALSLAGRVAAWSAEFAEAFSAELHTPGRQADLLAENLKIAGIVGRLGQSGHADPKALLLPADITGKLQQLMDRHSGVQARRDAAVAELDAARRDLEAACEATEDDTLPAHDQAVQRAAVRAALAAIQTDGVTGALKAAARQEALAKDAMDDALADLLPWRGDLATLATLPAPAAAELLAWRNALADADHRAAQREDELAAKQAERRLRQSELDALSQSTGIGTDEDAASIRGLRERAWSQHRQTLDEVSATAFEQTMRQDDMVTASRLQHATAAAALAQLRQALALAQTTETIAEEALETSRATLAARHADLRATIAALAPDLPATTSLPQLEAWLSKREHALVQSAAWRSAKRDRHAAEAAADAAHARLADAMKAAGLSFDAGSEITALMTAAQSALDRQTALEAALQKRRDAQRNVTAREQKLANAQIEHDDWHSKWSAVCGGCWLGGAGVPPSLATVREILVGLGDLALALDRYAVLARRISDMQAKQDNFAREVAEVAAVLGLDTEGASPLATARTIMQAVQDAVTAKHRFAEKCQALDEKKAARQALLDKQTLHEAHRTKLTAYFGVDTLAAAAVMLADAHKKSDLEADAANVEREIADTMLTTDFSAAEAMLAGADQPALNAEHASLQAKFDDLDRRTHDLFAHYSKAQDAVAAVGGDGEAARLEAQRRTVLLDIEDGARRYLKLRVGTMAAEHALLAYRQQHRSSMMARASDAFQMISRGAYRSLAAQPKRDGGEELIVLPAEGGSKLAKCLSKGTRFQLYLALRVAGYHEFAAMRDTVPFIADDIMETFDDFRAEEALRVFADMAASGQVIYLTHHRHLCDIATRICPGVRVHGLG